METCERGKEDRKNNYAKRSNVSQWYHSDLGKHPHTKRRRRRPSQSMLETNCEEANRMTKVLE